MLFYISSNKTTDRDIDLYTRCIVVHHCYASAPLRHFGAELAIEQRRRLDTHRAAASSLQRAVAAHGSGGGSEDRNVLLVVGKVPPLFNRCNPMKTFKVSRETTAT